MKRFLFGLLVLLIILGVGAGGVYWLRSRAKTQQTEFRTAAVKRGDLVVTISATGTVEPEEVIDVGAQVAGLINYFGKDKNGTPVDYGSDVEEGMVLAKIDDVLYQADVNQAQASVDLAKSGIIRAQADLGQMKAKLEQSQGDWERAQKLGPSDALAETTYDAYKATYEIAKANVAVGEATILQMKDTVNQAQAQLMRVQRNLGYCTITSPVKGVIIDRRVNMGQTVVSSLNAPSLFLIAKDLKRMQVWVAVNEADIGNIHAGQPVTFTADAFPGQTFTGEVGKVRLNATMTQNVVTYTVEVVTDNSSGRLLPYLTANAQFEVSRHKDVLQVPNAALRWMPRTEQIAPDFRQGPQKDATSQSAQEPAAETQATTEEAPAATEESTARGHGIVWVQDGQYVKPIRVRTGSTDNSMTEVSGRNLKEGMLVVTGERKAGTDEAAVTNPFTPQFGQAMRQRSNTKPQAEQGGQSTQGSQGTRKPQ